MNIQRAKQEIKNTIAAYLEKDEDGAYMIPRVRQRPVLLMGPPGIGKTQIMEQIAAECSLALVAYTITHHTRQSAIGLPFIVEKEYDGEKRSVTEYTMSEIIASVHDRMKASGKKEGILFIDEINCVSETLAPAMLQFLQGKTFGNQPVPEGWIIVAAGNPPQYNRSVREFDIVTLDRVKLIEVEADLAAWKTFAYTARIHGSILSYLDIHRENFYRIETTVEGKRFVTARGWQDLSEMICAYERLGIEPDRDVVGQYLQHSAVARDFANYLSLYTRYREDYRIEEILSGVIRPGTLSKLRFAPFDERLEVTALLLSRLSGDFADAYDQDRTTDRLFAMVKSLRTRTQEGQELIPAKIWEDIISSEEAAYEAGKQAGYNEKDLKRERGRAIRRAREWKDDLLTESIGAGRELTGEETFEFLRSKFEQESGRRTDLLDQAQQHLEYAFDFMENAFGESQEMVFFITELQTNFYADWFLKERECDRFYMYNKKLLLHDRDAAIKEQLDQIRDMQIT